MKVRAQDRRLRVLPQAPDSAAGAPAAAAGASAQLTPEPGEHLAELPPAARPGFALARPLLNLVATPGHMLFLDVLTAEPEHAFDLVSGTAQSIHGENVNRIAR